MSSPKKPQSDPALSPVASRRHLDVVLNCPQMPENVGGAARAIANMGLGDLLVVRPRTVNPELSLAMATPQGESVLKGARTFASLREALEPYELVVGTTARAGSRRGPLYTPRQIAPLLIGPKAPTTALVFGPERMGLTTAELHLCHKIVRVPTDNPKASSLNLAQSVLIMGYELLLAAGGEPAPPPPVKAASQKVLNDMYDDLESTLLKIGFLPENNPGHWLMNIKKIFIRGQLTKGECDLLRGICRQIRWAVNNLDRLE